MRTNYILIDFENVQPKTLTQLTKHPFKVFVFSGPHQSKLPLELVQTLQPLGDSVKYITITGPAHDALDFHIAYYIGKLSEKDPNGFFHIISKDKGFDPLIEHLKGETTVIRSTDISEIPMFRISSNKSIEGKVADVVKNLSGRGASRPRKEKTLFNTVKSLFSAEATPKDIEAVIVEMRRQKLVAVKEDGSVSYNLPKD